MNAHLDAARLQSLLLGEFTPQEESALAAHLAAGCETCEASLAELPAADEAALVALLARAEAAPAAPLPAEAIARALPRPWWRARPVWLVPVAAAALGLLLWLALPAQPAPDGSGQRVKGQEAPPRVVLTLGVVERDRGGQARVARLGSDAEVLADRSLVFKLSLYARCHLGLVRLGPDGVSEVLLPGPPGSSLALEPGAHTPAVRGSIAGLPLTGLRGRQEFVATCSATPLDLPAALAPLVRAQAEDREPGPGELAFGFSRVAIEVVEGAP